LSEEAKQCRGSNSAGGQSDGAIVRKTLEKTAKKPRRYNETGTLAADIKREPRKGFGPRKGVRPCKEYRKARVRILTITIGRNSRPVAERKKK